MFDLPHGDHKAFAKALTRARQDYEVKWWWKYGQPRIDLIRATLEVKTEVVGHVVSEVMALNREGVQATMKAGPYGAESVRIDVEIARPTETKH